jgi:membrane protein YqaA with SNARE-associated domain
MFWSSRRATRQVAPVDGAPQRRGAAAVARWRDRFERHPRAVLATVLVSAVVGLPPFYVVSVAAGAMGLQFRRFVFVGTLGRLLHFAAVAWMGR